MKRILVCGAGGFIGGHLVKKLKKQGHWVRAVDIKQHEFSNSPADEFIVGDLTDQQIVKKVLDQHFDEVYQLAADMGGAGYIFSGENDANLMFNSASINLNIIHQAVLHGVGKIFYSSSACIYPAYNQTDPSNPNCAEGSAYPAEPDSDYGWEKLFSERLYQAFARNHGLRIRIGRFHNVFGPGGAWCDGKEKAPAAICRKVAEAQDGGVVEVWGDGLQTRSFLYIDECLEAVERFMNTEFEGPLNIGSEEMVSINELTKKVIAISGKNLAIKNIPVTYQGVRGRRSDNTLIKQQLNWAPTQPLNEGLKKPYAWIETQVKAGVSA
jgi:nucleoside-diphosphate-sugar epimerase